MPRVLIFANDYTSIYNFRLELLAKLAADGHEVLLVIPADPRNQAFYHMGCNLIELPLSRFGANPLVELVSMIRLLRLLKIFYPDVVVTFTAKPNIYGGIACRFVKVPQIGAVTGLGATFQKRDAFRRLMVLLYRLAFRRAHAVFFENGHNSQVFADERIIPVAKSFVVAGAGVNLETHPVEAYPEVVGPTRFITVARIRRDKGFDELFEAIRRVSAVRDDVEFHLVGWSEDDSYQDAIEDMRHNYPVVVHGGVGQVKVHELLAESHCLIHPSHHEGMANVILEASAAGRPSLASDIPGCREAIDQGKSGLLFPVRSVEGIERSVHQFLSMTRDTQRDMGLAARKKMESEFNRQTVVGHYVDEINRAALPRKRKWGSR